MTFRESDPLDDFQSYLADEKQLRGTLASIKVDTMMIYLRVYTVCICVITAGDSHSELCYSCLPGEQSVSVSISTTGRQVVWCNHTHT